MPITVKVSKKTPSTKLPTRATSGAAGYDLYSTVDVIIQPGQTVQIDTNLSFEIPQGYYFCLVPRSSLGKKGLIIPNSPATIDEDYRGSISVILFNTGKYPIPIWPEDRIAQIILLAYNKFDLEEFSELSATERGSGGFGSTGR